MIRISGDDCCPARGCCTYESYSSIKEDIAAAEMETSPLEADAVSSMHKQDILDKRTVEIRKLISRHLTHSVISKVVSRTL